MTNREIATVQPPRPQNSSIAPHETAERTEDARAFQSEALSRNTRRNYAVYMNAWVAYCGRIGVEPYPADAVHLANWLAERAAHGARGGRRHGTGTGQSLGTVKLAFVAIRVAHKLKGLELRDTGGIIQSTLRGIRRVSGSDQTQVKAMRGHLIVAVIERLQAAGGPLEARDAALLSLGYMFARRRSELAGLDWRHAGSSAAGYLEIEAEHATLTISHHKTAMKEGVITIRVPRAENRIAFTAIETWIRLAEIKPGHPVLRRVRKNGKVGDGRLTLAAIAYIIKRRIYEHLRADGVPDDLARTESDLYSSHSLRHGFATTAAENGADLEAIGKITKHRGVKELRRYVEQADALRMSAHTIPGVGLNKPRRG